MNLLRGGGLLTGILIATIMVGCSSQGDDATSQPARVDPTAILVDAEAGTVSVPAEIAKQGAYRELAGAIEFLLVSKGGKEYETVFVTERTPQEIYDALLKIGLHPGRPAEGGAEPLGQPVMIEVELTDERGTRTVPDDRFILHVAKDSGGKKLPGRPLDATPWPFVGSGWTDDPETKSRTLRATLTGTIAALHPVEASPLFQNPRAEAQQSNIYFPNKAELPPAAASVRVVFGRAMKTPPVPARRVYVLLSGRVQGVGFRKFTETQARRAKLTGFVRNLPDGRVEALAEGPPEAVAEWLGKVRRGPRAARVENVDIAEETPAGDFESFDIWF